MTTPPKDGQHCHEPSDHKSPTPLKSPLRRKALKTMVNGSVALAAYHVLPETWERPLIEQVFLPAHAGPSGVTLSDPCSVSLVNGTTGSATVTVRVDGYVAPPVSGLAVQVAATPSGAGNPASGSVTTSSTGAFNLQLTIAGGPGITAVSVQSSVAGASGVAVCSLSVPVEATTTAEATTTVEATTTAEATTTGVTSTTRRTSTTPRN